MAMLEEPQDNFEAELAERALQITRLEERRKKFDAGFKRFLKICGRFLLLVIAVAVTVPPLAFYLEGDRKGGLTNKMVVDYRSCEIKIPDTTYVLTGTRSYRYRYHEFNGYRMYHADTVVEETRLDIKGTPMSIIGTSAGEATSDTWVKNIDQGERYSQPLENKERYTFVLGDTERFSVTVDYSEMCK